LELWQHRGLQIEVTVDRAPSSWLGHVGVVTTLIQRAPFDPGNTVAMICGPEVMMRYAVFELQKRGLLAANIFLSIERNMKCAVGFCGHCQFGRSSSAKMARSSAMIALQTGLESRSCEMKTPRKPKLAVWKFASCDGCQLSLLDCEDELLAVAGAVQIARFAEASRAVVRGPYDLS